MAAETTSNLTPEELKNLMPTAQVIVPDTTGQATAEIPAAKLTRRFMLIGTGDGGCNIAEDIHKEIPDTYFIAYNTSPNAQDDRHANMKIIPYGEDGSGKARTYSQDVFRKGSYRELLKTIAEVQASPKFACDYVMIISTTDGGTGGGVSPMMAKFLADNLEVPVLLLGIYPDINEDATAQYNTMQWQGDTEKGNLCYLILDNNCGLPRIQYQELVNKQAVAIMNILSGRPFGETTLSQIDNKDMHTLLTRFPGRITVHAGTTKPGVGMSIGSYLVNVFGKWNQPAPSNARGYGLFIKAPESVLKNADTSLAEIREVAGDVPIQYTHLEKSDSEIMIALICAGCSEPTDRIIKMRERYDDIQNALKEHTSSTETLTAGISDPLGGSSSTGKGLKGGDMNLSALGL